MVNANTGMTFGLALRGLTRSKGLTQAELARRVRLDLYDVAVVEVQPEAFPGQRVQL